MDGYLEGGTGVGQFAVAARDREHGTVGYEQRWVGLRRKQTIPSSRATAAERQVIAAGEEYVIMNTGRVEVPTGSWSASITRGELVWIDPDDDRLSYRPADPVEDGLVPVGRVHAMPGERGIPSGASVLRVDLDFKV